MFGLNVLIPTYAYTKNRIMIPPNIAVSELYNYIAEEIKGQYNEDFLGFYAVWDTKLASEKHDMKTYPYNSGKLDFYLHIYVFRESRNRPVYMQARYLFPLCSLKGVHQMDAPYSLTQREIGGHQLKEVDINNVSSILSNSVLKGISSKMVYSKDLEKGRHLSDDLPNPYITFDKSSLEQLLHTINTLKLTDGITLNPFFIVTTTKFHSLEAFQQAFLIAKLVGGLRKLNHWTTRMQRRQIKQFKAVYAKTYPTEIENFYALHQTKLSRYEIMAGAYLPVDSLISYAIENDKDLTMMLFNPFASIRLTLSEYDISTQVVHRLCRQSLDDSMTALEQSNFKELLVPLITA